MEKEETINNEKPKKIFKYVFDIFFWVFITLLLCLWLTDFIKTSKNEEPLFCIKNNNYKYDDGNIYECIGAGYKVVKYARTSKSQGREFIPLFIKTRK
ncbi:MAG: hypothetical protein RSD96_01905 [Bacilli bacterium]